MHSGWLHDKLSSQKAREFFRFCITGGVSTLTVYGVYGICLRMLSPSLAFSAGYICAFIINYILTVSFTFKVKASAKNGMGFIASNMINYALSVVVLNLFIFVGVPDELAPMPMFCVTIPVNFLIVRLVMKKS